MLWVWVAALAAGCEPMPAQQAGLPGSGGDDGAVLHPSSSKQAIVASTCTPEREAACAAFGTQCVDQQCSGGFGAGHGCTQAEEEACARFGTQCVDHQCSGGFGMGSGCTAREQLDCANVGCGCVDHACAGGFCPGDGCTAREQIRCGDRGFECKEHECVCAGESDCLQLACPRPGGTTGPINPAGGSIAPTGTYTDWFWPGPVDSMEWDLQIEHDIPRDGYFWSHQFGFENGPAGYFGLQAHGGFQADPGGPIEVTKMAVFSIGGAAIRGELGEFSYPNGRIHGDFDGDDGVSMHVRFEWRACEVYRLRVARESVEPNGDTWIAAFIRDPALNSERYIGRILIPAAWGRFSSASVVWTERFGPSPVTDCGAQQHASAIFGEPTANGGTVRITGRSNHFYNPPSCPNSRFTDFPDAVRQEMGAR